MKKYFYLLLSVVMMGCLDSEVSEPRWDSYSQFDFVKDNEDEVWERDFSGYELPLGEMSFRDEYSLDPFTRLEMEVKNNSSDGLVGMATIKVDGLEVDTEYESSIETIRLHTSITESEYDEQALNGFLNEKTGDKYLNGIFLKYGVFTQKPESIVNGTQMELTIETGENHERTDDLDLIGRIPVNSVGNGYSNRIIKFRSNEQGEAWVTLVWMSNIKQIDHSVNFDFLRVLFNPLEVQSAN